MKFKNIYLSLCFAVALFSCQDEKFSSVDSLNPSEIKTLEDHGIADAEGLALACEGAEDDLVEEVVSIKFKENNVCNWSENGNLDRRNQFVQARYKNSQKIEIPEGSVLCGIAVESKENVAMRYDDFLFFNIEERIMFSSNGLLTTPLTQGLTERTDYINWDFEKVKGLRIQNFNAPAYCLGGAGFCTIPATDTEGIISLSVPNKLLAPLAFELFGKPEIDLDLVATGDNDEEDCMHSALDLEVTLQLLK